jgi:methylthioribulose-1-phosphate dehydratase
MIETLPILPNSQDMRAFSESLTKVLAPNIHGFLIAGHGLYTWGQDLASARRHIETFEFLFECLGHEHAGV